LYRPALSHKPTKTLQSWEDFVYGQSIKTLYERQLQSIAKQCFGYHLVKLGALSQALEFKGCQIKHQFAQTSNLQQSSGVIASSGSLPYAERSIDAFLLTHVLDFAQDPHQILREVDFCLIPNGQIVVIGFNPYSPAGIARLLPVKRGNPIHKARCFSRSRVSDWLSLLGYEITVEKRFLFADFLFANSLPKARQWHRFVQNHLSFFASVYVIVGKKREFPLSLIKPKWKPVPKFSPVGASVRTKG
jgi:SAM-dependent methyltransferase